MLGAGLFLASVLLWVEMEGDKIVRIVYTNYRGETGARRIVPKEIKFGSTQYHPQEQWLLVAYDVDKNAERTFAVKDIKSWQV